MGNALSSYAILSKAESKKKCLGIVPMAANTASSVIPFSLRIPTNLDAAGMSGEKLSHDEVIAAGKASATKMGTLLAKLITAL